MVSACRHRCGEHSLPIQRFSYGTLVEALTFFKKIGFCRRVFILVVFMGLQILRIRGPYSRSIGSALGCEPWCIFIILQTPCIHSYHSLARHNYTLQLGMHISKHWCYC